MLGLNGSVLYHTRVLSEHAAEDFMLEMGVNSNNIDSLVGRNVRIYTGTDTSTGKSYSAIERRD